VLVSRNVPLRKFQRFSADILPCLRS